MNSLDYQNIFHEIKNTITLVNSSMQLLDKKCPTLESEPYWNNMKAEITYLKNMILKISQAGNMTNLQKEPVELNSFLKDLCNCMKDTYPDLHWNLHTDPALPVLHADVTKLRQAILNLLKNSAEAQNGSGYVTIETHASESNIKISITDHGKGIPADLEDRIFDLFTTTKEHGTGLGLAITKHIIENHNGELILNNRPGDGCTFSIFLPIDS